MSAPPVVDRETGEVLSGEIVTGVGLALPEDAAVLDAVSDPGAYCLAALDRAKAWLATATTTDLPDVVEAKCRAEAIRVYVAQKELGKDAELSATEIVRRAERRIGQLIREGQDEGTIRRRGNSSSLDDLPKVTDFAKQHELTGNGTDAAGIYDFTDGVTDPEFDEAVQTSKEQANLSRTNLVRNIGKGKAARKPPLGDRLAEIQTHADTGMTSRQIATKMGVSEENLRLVARKNDIRIPADEMTRGARRLDSNRIVREAVSALEGIVIGLSHANVADLDPSEVENWATSLKSSIRDVNRFLKEMTQ